MTPARDPKQSFFVNPFEESWKRNQSRGIMEEESWRRNQERGIIEVESWRRTQEGGIMEKESWRRNHGEASSWEASEASERHLMHLGGIWEASERHLGGI